MAQVQVKLADSKPQQTDDSDNDFQQLLQKYSQYLSTPHDSEQLLELGQKLFDDTSNEIIERPSYLLLKKKESELSSHEVKSEAKVKALPQKEKHVKPEQAPASNQDNVAEELLFLQDKNALCLARRKKLENQRNKLLEDYGQLMEQSIQRKVQLKLDMQKLKAELNEALSRSRPEAQQNQDTVQNEKKRPIMEELTDLNQQVLMRIGSFKMAISNNKVTNERTVLDRYKPHMEKILGQIYAYSEYLPVNAVVEKFTQISDEIEHEIRNVNRELQNEHERNYQLQKEATQLGDEVKEHELEVSRLKQRNQQLQKEINLLKEIGDKEIETMKNEYSKLLDGNLDGETLIGPPLSSRAVVASAGPVRKMKRSPSRKDIITRERATLSVPPVEKFVEMMKAQLLDKINHAQNN